MPDDPQAPAARKTTRERLLDVTFELLLEQGYQATTVQAVARKAGLTVGAIYANFENKHDLMAQAVLAAWGTQGLNVETLAGTEALPFDALLPVLAMQMAAPPMPHHRLLTEITGTVMREVEGPSPLIESTRLLDAITRTNVEAAKARGELDADVPSEALVNLIVNLMLGSITSKSFGLPQPSLEDSIALIARIAGSLRTSTSS